MTHRLFEHAVTCVNEDDAQVCCTGTGDHVACVLNVSRGISDDKLSFWGGKISVCHVDGDALLALGP